MEFKNNLDKQKWRDLSIMIQLWNIGSEFSRAVKAKNKKNDKRFRWAIWRMIGLFEITLDQKNNLRWSQIKEICRVKEVVCDFLCGDNIYRGDTKSLQKYFDTFVNLNSK